MLFLRVSCLELGRCIAATWMRSCFFQELRHMLNKKSTGQAADEGCKKNEGFQVAPMKRLTYGIADAGVESLRR
jgi:hypothetical protein